MAALLDSIDLAKEHMVVDTTIILALSGSFKGFTSRVHPTPYTHHKHHIPHTHTHLYDYGGLETSQGK